MTYVRNVFGLNVGIGVFNDCIVYQVVSSKRLSTIFCVFQKPKIKPLKINPSHLKDCHAGAVCEMGANSYTLGWRHKVTMMTV